MRTGVGLVSAFLFGALFAAAPARASDDLRYADQGANWTDAARAQYYSQDEGSQLIPLAWLRALRQSDGTPFLATMSRYGFLPNPDEANRAGLPVGFTRAKAPQGAMVGMTCSACHVRQIVVDKTIWRIDGGPAFVDFATFTADLDAAMGRVVDDDGTFFDKFRSLCILI